MEMMILPQALMKEARNKKRRVKCQAKSPENTVVARKSGTKIQNSVSSKTKSTFGKFGSCVENLHGREEKENERVDDHF